MAEFQIIMSEEDEQFFSEEDDDCSSSSSDDDCSSSYSDDDYGQNYSQKDGLFSIVLSVHHGNYENFKKLILLENGEIDLFFCNIYEILNVACRTPNRLKFIKFLLKKGLNINGFKNNCSPLIGACENMNLETIEFLISNGAKLIENIEDYKISGNNIIILKKLINDSLPVNVKPAKNK
jgi:hypothetical protein